MYSPIPEEKARDIIRKSGDQTQPWKQSLKIRRHLSSMHLTHYTQVRLLSAFVNMLWYEQRRVR